MKRLLELAIQIATLIVLILEIFRGPDDSSPA